MIDGIIKADGTSRLARSVADFKTRYPTYDAFAEALIAGTLPLDILFNAAGWTQVPDFLNKANLLKDATAEKFGLGSEAVLDDVFAFLGKYNQHSWQRRTKNFLEVKALADGNKIATDTYSTVQYSSSIAIDADGNVSLVNPSSIALNLSYTTAYSDLVALAPCYITSGINNGAIYYLPSGATGSQDSSSSVWLSVSQDALIVGDPSDTTLRVLRVFSESSYGEPEILFSGNRNEYPDSGTSDGYEYEYRGIPYANILIAPRIATGSYIGTGTYGEENPIQLTFDFVPRFVFVQARTSVTLEILPFVHGLKYTGHNTSSGSSSYVAYVSWNEKMVSWYAESGAVYMMNESGMTYNYVAIG